MSTAASITAAVADASLDAARALILDDTGDFLVQIYTTAFGTKLAEFEIDGALLAAAAAGSTGKRAIVIDCTPPIDTVGLDDGTAALGRILSQAGVKRYEMTAGGIGSGEAIILSNTSIATDQPLSMLSGRIQMAFQITE